MPFDQVFLMHCTPGDSILGESGYSIRATSIVREDNTPDIEHPLLSEASKLFSYELPPAYGRFQPDPKTAPVRLSAIPIKEQNVVALMHSVYVPFDTRGRPNSYFTHVIFIPYDQFTWRDALKTWGKIQWEINLEDIPEEPAQADFFKTPHWLAYWPPHATQVLPKLDSLPNSGLDDSLLNSLFTPRPDETYWKNLLSHLCHTIKDPAKLVQPGGADNEKEKNGVLAYLLRREAPLNEGEELIGETIRATGAPTLHPNLGQSMDETFRHLLLAAYLFPVELTRPFGFSTYEPESHGVGIARGRLLAALVKSADEPENDFLKDSLGYYPNPPGNETQNQEAEEATGHYFADLPPGLLEAFTKSSIPVQKFAEEINFLFQGYNGKEWKTFENSLTLFWRLQSAKKNCDYKSTVILTQKKYWDNSHVKKEFEELKPKLLLPYAQECFAALKQPVDKVPEPVQKLIDHFNWEESCKCFCSKGFWQGFLKEGNEDQVQAFLANIQFFENLCRILKKDPKDQLLNSLNNLLLKKEFLKEGFLKECWKNNGTIQESVWEFFYSHRQLDWARYFFEKANFDLSFKLGIQKIEEEKTDQKTREEMVLFLINKSLEPGADNKWLKEKNGFRNFTRKKFSRALANLFRKKGQGEQTALKSFFTLMKNEGNSTFFTVTMENLLGGIGITDEDSPLFKEITISLDYLGKEIIKEFFFKGELPESINIIKKLNRVPSWLKPPLESFLGKLTWESFLIKENIYYTFPFENLFEVLNNARSGCPDYTVLEDGSFLRKSLNEFPSAFNPKLFSQSRWTKGKKKEKEKIIEFLWKKEIKEPPPNGYDLEKTERVLDFIRLLNPIETKSVILNITDHFEKIPFQKDSKNRILIFFSLYKHGLVKQVTGIYKDEKNQLINLFLKHNTVIGNICPFGADLIGPLLKWYRLIFFIVWLIACVLLYFYTENANLEKITNGIFAITCALWGIEGLFSKLNDLVSNEEIKEQKIFVSIWAFFGILIVILGFPYSNLYSPYGTIGFYAIEFIWLGLFAKFYKNGAERFLAKGNN